MLKRFQALAKFYFFISSRRNFYVFTAFDVSCRKMLEISSVATSFEKREKNMSLVSKNAGRGSLPVILTHLVVIH